MNDPDKRHAAIGRAIERAANELPSGSLVQICITRGSVTAYFSASLDDFIDLAGGLPGDVADQINAAIEDAKTEVEKRHG